MGSFAGYYGNMDVPKEKRKELTQRVMKLLEQGGMMKLEPVSLFDKQVGLLSPLKPDKDGAIIFDYNYFEDDRWETAYYDTQTAEFHSQKIGGYEFSSVVSAIYVLYEFYTREFGLAEVDGEIFDAEDVIGWLNYLFDENYTNARFQETQRVMELLSEASLDGIREDVQRLCTRAQKEKPLPVEKINTLQYLWTPDESFRYWGSMSAAFNNYHLSDDDRAFFWTPGGDVRFSPSMFWWLQSLCNEFNGLMTSEGSLLNEGQNFVELMMNTLYEANQVYHNIFAFKDMFYEFISHSGERKVQAVFLLFQRIVERYKDAAAKVAKINGGKPWDSLNYNFQCYPGRLNVKRYLAILANPVLRQKLFGF